MMVITVGVAAHPVKRPHFQVEIFAKIFYLETMRIVDDIEQQIQQSEAGTLFFVSDFAKAGMMCL